MSSLKCFNIACLLLVTLAALDISNGQIVSSGDCPCNVKVLANFEVSPYLGLWYEYAKYPVYFEGNGVCITAEYTLQDDGNVGVKNTQINGTTGQPEDIVGFASVVTNAKLSVTFPVSPAYNATSNYWVLDTDYSNYSVVYSCQPLGNQHSTTVWILTRERLPAPEYINAALNVLQKNKISLKPLTVTNQISCA